MKLNSTLTRSALGLLLLPLATLVTGQGILDAVPQCYQDCIEQSGDFTCNGIDIKCLCRLSNGNFITNVITCIRANCDNNLNTTQLVGPVAEVCRANGVPIAPAVIENAKNIGASLAGTATSTLTRPTTVTSTIASAGTMYVVAFPLSPTTGPSGVVRTVTATPRTLVMASISGGSGISVSTVTSTETETSSTTTSTGSSSATAAATTTVTAAVGGGEGDAGPTPQNGDGNPFSNGAYSSRETRGSWLAIGVIPLVGALLF